ncbi:MAG: AAA family ATPase [bacterium]|nr:AAA family ATPase [bacterium]
MKLEQFTIGSPKNSPTHCFGPLKAVTLDFARDRGVTALVGESGTGKSTALEALAVLFRDLMAGKPAPAFAYTLTYRAGETRLRIDADPDREDPYRIAAAPASEDGPAEGTPLALAHFLDAGGAFLPRRLIGYSSGTNPRPRDVFEPGRFEGAPDDAASDSERQKRAVLGALRHAAEGGNLVLLDGPDSHLYPRDCATLSDRLAAFAGESIAGRAPSHIVFATHQPITVASLLKEQVQILRRTPGARRIDAARPIINPRGMGFAGVLTSEVFDHASCLDRPTQQDVATLHRLSARTELDEAEQSQLRALRHRLEGLGFNFASADPLEQDYLRARFDLAEDVPPDSPLLAPENRRKALAALVRILLVGAQAGST